MPSPTAVAPPPLPLLRTPRSAGPFLPSELPRSPHPGLDAIKQEDQDIRTPITPPTAYTDFLKALSPAVSTPLTSNSLRSAFSFSDKTGHLTPISQPSSAGSNCSCQSQAAQAAAAAADSRIKTTVLSAPLYPSTPFLRPTPTRTLSARSPTTLKKLRIPQSPSSSSSVTECSSSATPKSATPKSATPKSSTAAPISSISARSPYSPTSWYLDGKTRVFGPPLSASPRHVSVKQVVTRTVTYRATALEPAPRGKRRKLNDEAAAH